MLPELHGEILAAALDLVLALPWEVVHVINFDKFADVLVMTMRLGLSHRASAITALDALERMVRCLTDSLSARLTDC